MIRAIFAVCLVFHMTECSKLTDDKSFVVTFQEGIKNIDYHVDDQWLEYTSEIPSFEDFTACHWMKIFYFSKEMMPIWSYCMVQGQENSNFTDCIRISFIPENKSANRNLKAKLVVPRYRSRGEQLNKASYILLKPFKHRAWNHVCWRYSRNLQCHSIFYNGVLMGKKCDTHEKSDKWLAIPSSKNLSKHRVIVGQEQDEVEKYKFDYRKTLNGKLTEINIWGKMLTSTEIRNLSHCYAFPKGDILSWTQSRYTSNKAAIESAHDLSFLCDEDKKLIISTQPQTFSSALDTCRILGGVLIVPQSLEDNNAILHLFEMHKKSCLLQESCISNRTTDNMKCHSDEPVAWIGLKQKGGKWFYWDGKNKNTNMSNFTNWDDSCSGRGYGNAECAYMKRNGYWRYGTEKKCNSKVLKLCPICHVSGTKPFTVNGFDDIKWIDWNFYPVLDNQNQVSYFDGYKNAKLIKHNGDWTFYPKNGSLQQHVKFRIKNDRSFPTGRIQWSQYPLNGNLKDAKKSLISFSHCRFGDEFTCSSGKCVEKLKRCNHVKDCEDGSDEENCSYIAIPEEYTNTTSPGSLLQYHQSSFLARLRVQINILSIDAIDTCKMIVTLTMEIRIRWFDGRLTYKNLVENETNFIPERESNGIWLPLNNIIFIDSVAGDTFRDDTKEIAVRASRANGTDAENSYEDSQFYGDANELEMTQIFKVSFKCIFDLYQFPFDQETCEFPIKMRRTEKLTNILVEDYPQPIIYNGPNITHQFKIWDFKSFSNYTGDGTNFTFTLELKRNYMHQIFATFFPTFLLWLLTYATLFIDIDDFDNRFQGSTTTMLVLAALLNSITSSLPKTSYLKLIDIWFFWHTLAIFSLIIFHIILAKIGKNISYRVYKEDKPVIQNGFEDLPIEQKDPLDDNTEVSNGSNHDIKNSDNTCLDKTLLRIYLNRTVIITLPLFSIIFYANYFYFTIRK